MSFINSINEKARRNLKHILLPEGIDERTQRAASIVTGEEIANVTLFGNEDEVRTLAKKRGINLSEIRIVDPLNDSRVEEFAVKYQKLREKKRVSYEEALKIIRTPMYFAAMMLHIGLADGIIAGAQYVTSDVLRPGLQIVKTIPTVPIISACYILSIKNSEFGTNGLILFADCSVTPNPTSEMLAHIAVSTASTAKVLCDIEPNVAMLSFSTKGSAAHEMVEKVARATEIARKLAPNINIDGELQADAALVPSVGNMKCPDSPVAGKANVLIFPDLQSANISYKLVHRLAGAEPLGPVTQGFNKPINDLSRGCSTNDIVNLIAITAVQAQEGC